MRERVERIGGRLEHHSSPGGGFSLTVWFPLPNEEGLNEKD
jgi:signal transduction histidine kinase